MPGHAEATIRLHKARIKALEGDVEKLTGLAAGAGPMRRHAPRCLAEAPLLALTPPPPPHAGKEKQLAEAVRELKALRAEQGAWSKDKKALEAQVWARHCGWSPAASVRAVLHAAGRSCCAAVRLHCLSVYACTHACRSSACRSVCPRQRRPSPAARPR